MVKIFLPSCIIAFLFTAFWLVKYPQEIWESLTFRNDDGFIGILVSIGIWFFLFGAVIAIVMGVNLIYA
jgi:hypothetical protein